MVKIEFRPQKLKICTLDYVGNHLKNISSKYELYPTENKYILPKVAGSPYLKHRLSDIEDLSHNHGRFSDEKPYFQRKARNQHILHLQKGFSSPPFLKCYSCYSDDEVWDGLDAN